MAYYCKSIMSLGLNLAFRKYQTPKKDEYEH